MMISEKVLAQIISFKRNANTYLLLLATEGANPDFPASPYPNEYSMEAPYLKMNFQTGVNWRLSNGETVPSGSLT